MSVLHLLGAAASSLAQPRVCAGCSAPVDEPLCQACWDVVEPAPEPVRPISAPPGFPVTVAAGPYVGLVRDLLLAHKEHGRADLARPLGALLAAAVADVLDDPSAAVALVPVPSQRSSTRRRGHDAVLRMARMAARTLGEGASVAPVLRHRRRVEDQSRLTLTQRRDNLADALVAAPVPGALRPGMLVVVDDVCSSGATLAAARSALLSGRWPPDVVRAAVVASPPRRTGRTQDHVPVTRPIPGD